jgi:hypothetical protein
MNRTCSKSASQQQQQQQQQQQRRHQDCVDIIDGACQP